MMRVGIGLLLLCVSLSVAAKDLIYTSFFSDKALEGHDTVAYFTQGTPVKGKSDYSTEYKGAVWLFASQENLDLFTAAPESYAPQYGGYCAWAVSAKNDFAKGDPNYWTIVDNKLYLNYNQKIKDRWEQDRAMHIKQADTNWPLLIK